LKFQSYISLSLSLLLFPMHSFFVGVRIDFFFPFDLRIGMCYGHILTCLSDTQHNNRDVHISFHSLLGEKTLVHSHLTLWLEIWLANIKNLIYLWASVGVC
jgi:hypothetical protein